MKVFEEKFKELQEVFDACRVDKSRIWEYQYDLLYLWIEYDEKWFELCNDELDLWKKIDEFYITLTDQYENTKEKKIKLHFSEQLEDIERRKRYLNMVYKKLTRYEMYAKYLNTSLYRNS